MDDAARRELLDLFGDRVALDPSERLLYDHDHLPLPDQIEDRIDHVPDAVVKPTSAEEVVDLVEFAQFHEVALTPRGGGTERYGGATPTQAGIVVDTTLMDEVVEVGDGTARVQAGVTFQELEETLDAEGLMPKVRSEREIAATVGGFAAHGGTGLGSLEWGPFAETVEAIEVVTPDGEIREVDDRDRDLYLGTHGGLGVITEVTLDVAKQADLKPVLVGFDSLQDLQDCLYEHQLYTVPILSIHLKSPDHVDLQQEATGSSHLPSDRWLALFVFRAKDWSGTFETQVHREYEVQEVFWDVLDKHDAEEVSGDAATEELARLGEDLSYSKLGPGFVATDGRVPVKKIRTFVDRAFDRSPGELKAVTAHLIGYNRTTGPTDRRDLEACVTMHMADDISRPDYDLAAGSSFGIVDAAESVGGRAHATGLLFAHEAKAVHGKRKLDRIRRLKEAVDPAGLMNPGKVSPVKVSGPLGIPVKLTTLSKLAEPIAALSAPFVGYEGPDEEFISERAVAEVMRADSDRWDEVAWDLNACTQCGYCIEDCEVLDPISWASSGTRGKLYLLRQDARARVRMGRKQVERLHQCTECGYCDEICPVGIEPTRIYRHAKRKLDRAPDGYEAIRDHVLEEGNPFGEPREDRGDWVPGETPDEGEVLFHAGCAGAYEAGEVATRALGTLKQLGYDPVVLGEEEVCAGGPLVTAGFEDAFAKLAGDVIRTVRERGIETIVCLGAEEAKTFADDYPEVAETLGLEWDVEVKTFEQVVVECQDRGQLEAIPQEDDDEEEEEESSARARARGRGGDDEGTKVVTYAPPQLTRVLDRDCGSTAIVEAADDLSPVEADLDLGIGIGGNVPDWFPDLARQRAEEFLDREADRGEMVVVGDTDSYVHLTRMADEVGVDLEIHHLAELVLERFELSELTEDEEEGEAEDEEEIDLSHLSPKERAIKRAKIIAERKRSE